MRVSITTLRANATSNNCTLRILIRTRISRQQIVFPLPPLIGQLMRLIKSTCGGNWCNGTVWVQTPHQLTLTITHRFTNGLSSFYASTNQLIFMQWLLRFTALYQNTVQIWQLLSVVATLIYSIFACLNNFKFLLFTLVFGRKLSS